MTESKKSLYQEALKAAETTSKVTGQQPSWDFSMVRPKADKKAAMDWAFSKAAPRKLTVVEYCTEEVQRQGHDTFQLDGIERVGWMLDAWSYALRENENTKPIALRDIERMGYLIERAKNAGGFRTCGVTVGGRLMPPWFHVEAQVKNLVRCQKDLDPLGFYRAFLEIHPFVDGNGRTAKVLLNWLNGTLLENPVFPPKDFWGRVIRNP